MDVLQKARELAQALAESEEVLRFREAEAKLLNHPEALKKLQELKKQDCCELDRVDEPLIQEYLAAYRSFYNLMEAIKYILNDAYDGDLGEKRGCTGCCNQNSLH